MPTFTSFPVTTAMFQTPAGRHQVGRGRKRVVWQKYPNARPGPPPPNHGEDQDPKVMRLYLVMAPETANEIPCASDSAAPVPPGYDGRC
jgi:hypothetical protein